MCWAEGNVVVVLACCGVVSPVRAVVVTVAWGRDRMAHVTAFEGAVHVCVFSAVHVCVPCGHDPHAGRVWKIHGVACWAGCA